MACKCKNPVADLLFSIFILMHSLAYVSDAVNTITRGQSLRDGESLISVENNFELGFFNPENSSFRYVGIWYYKIEVKAIVWVANRENPVSDRNGVFRIGSDGNLEVLDGNGTSVWSSNVSVLSNNTAAILLDSGNLVLSSNESIGDTGLAYWQSFNYPTDTFLPGMRVRVNTQIGENFAFTSWKSPNDPSPGNFTMGIDPFGGPQIVIWDQRKRIWRSGQWDNSVFTGVPSMIYRSSYLYGFKLSQREADGSMYFTYSASDPSDLLRFQISWNGTEEQLRWEEDNKKWSVTQSQPTNKCGMYNHCGNFGVCNELSSPTCKCLDGFEPKFPYQWSSGDWSGGCDRREKLQCQMNSTEAIGNSEQDEFKMLKSMKLPDFAEVFSLQSPDACRTKCLQNCSCNAYANIIGIGCMLWTGDLVDINQFDEAGSLLFLRVAHSESGGRDKIAIFVVLIIVLVSTILLGISVWLLWRFKIKQKVLLKRSSTRWVNNTEMQTSEASKSEELSADLSRSTEFIVDGKKMDGPELPLFNFFNVAAATNNFSEANMLGKGGFGIVYKGELADGQKIAVKRLSGKSSQGLDEFKNEIILIAKLQHRNLVRLLGCCIQGEEKMLLYEYMPNKSLDCFLFDETKRAQLHWRNRFTIIEGIARGLLYLHRDSRLRIIHRDLKASNILLDEGMNPKISDFGMARMFWGNQNEGNTVRVVGTYGYMSPEYAMEGLFSVKSDVYSFGVLLLEIVSGRRNTSFRSSDHCSLISYAWHLWSEDKAMELVDPLIQDTCSPNEVLKCIHIGMLCVQDSAAYRPSVNSVLLMLESENPTLPIPRQPTFTSMRASTDAEICTESANHLTVTMVAGR